MNNKKVAIIGGGLSGLYAAYLLEKNGITDYVLLEARDVFGGRISSTSSCNTLNSSSTDGTFSTDNIDLGPTWFWPDFQHQLDSLISELGLERFNQYDTGNMIVERSPNEAPVTMRGFTASPQSMRLSGGMEALTSTLRSKLQNKDILLNRVVRKIQHSDASIDLNNDANIDIHFQEYSFESNQPQRKAEPDTLQSVSVQHVLLALPPRLVENSIEFIPALPTSLVTQWRNTATWMAAHAKYVAVYDTPFWREAELSGSAQSRIGPMVEIHDASMPKGSAALFGFLGVPATTRNKVTHEELKAHCLNQLTRLFGHQASTPKLDVLKDWAQDQYTATPLDFDGNETGEHGRAPETTAINGPWSGKLIGVGSEWSTQFPGYVAGAIEAASEGVAEYLKAHI